MVARIAIGLVAIAIDLGIWLTLRGAPSIDHEVLRWFVLINVPVLSADVVVSVAMFRFPRTRRMWLVNLSVVAEGLTIAVWLQATGTLSSYFIPAGILLIVLYRMNFGWSAGLALTLAMIAFHVGAVVLEMDGVLRPEALFVGMPSKVYTVAGYQRMALTSLFWLYVCGFVGANAIVNRLRDKDLALAEVRREVDRVAADARHGRLTGTLLDERYALGELLGRGGMGEIYAARRVADDVQVAIKVLHGHLVEDDTMLERFKREASLAARLPPEHIARVYEVGGDQARSLHFIVMEYLRGEDLGAYFRRRGPLAVGDVVGLGRAIATALDDAHAAGVVHRDLKPQNVFLLGDGDGDGRFEVRLLDFGIAGLHAAGSHTLTQGVALMGTPGYMPPEQALGRMASVGPASDRFAMAAILYRALTGRLPFAASDLGALIQEIVHADPPAPSTLIPGLPGDVDLVFALGLAKRPGDRYPSAASMIDELAAAARGELGEPERARARALTTGFGDAETLEASATVEASDTTVA
jgi:predicted Ser/Thr protein kinase